eukprot:TRINITY_DN667_c0_g1_i1.p1 TRINITY_DN667_c0_g1~~TRINITY_DN667_c0_g1_i1.p1  ORF type:complete len:117 (+),score=21.71 TRINITY_DN667_c0_g1_i1:67-417(+)
MTISQAVSTLIKDYNDRTPTRMKLIDLFMFYHLLTGAIQFLYCVIVGTFPFNSFLAGFISSVAGFVLTASLRMHLNPQNSNDFSSVTKTKSSPEVAFMEYLFCSLVLHLWIFNFIG